MIEIRVIQESVDYSIYGSKPTKFKDHFISYLTPSNSIFTQQLLKIRYNTIQAMDDYI